MGMFDDIKYEAPCFKCGGPVRGFQSKGRAVPAFATATG